MTTTRRFAMAKGFQKTVDRWLDEADGNEDELVDAIALWVEDSDETDIDEMARYVAKLLLADNDNEDEED
jgi:hypothetical protein